jgi:hypothetical protein
LDPPGVGKVPQYAALPFSETVAQCFDELSDLPQTFRKRRIFNIGSLFRSGTSVAAISFVL